MRKGRRWKKKSAANWLWARHTQVSLYPSEIDCPKTSRTQRFFSATETTPPRRGTSSFILYLLFFLLPCTFQLSCGSPLHKSVRHSGQEKPARCIGRKRNSKWKFRKKEKRTIYLVSTQQHRHSAFFFVACVFRCGFGRRANRLLSRTANVPPLLS